MTLELLVAPPRRPIIPTGDDVHIWTLRHDEARPYEDARCAGVLTAEEIARLNRFRHVHQRVRRINARGALRHILSSYFGTEPTRIDIHAGVHGKPGVAGVEFNCSHAPSLTLVAVAAQPVGVDVEPISACDGIEAIRHRFMNEADHDDVAASPPSRASIEMLRLWVIKEACLKAIGAGLAIDLRELSVGRASPAEFDITCGADSLRARLLAIPGGHVAAIAGRTLDNVVAHDQVNF